MGQKRVPVEYSVGLFRAGQTGAGGNPIVGRVAANLVGEKRRERHEVTEIPFYVILPCIQAGLIGKRLSFQ
jgi:hypothetical protein